jgi:UDP-N-acetylmuramoylalanine--D-glutamate ligase
MDYSSKRVVILGLARQGVALARFLAEQGAWVTVSDRQSAEQLAGAREALHGLPIEYVLGGHPETLLDGADRLCLSGGVDANLPLAVEARRRGIALSNDAQIFLEACPTPHTVGITGSAGKTTTTTLVGRMLAAASAGVWVGGNIGNPLIAEVGGMAAGDLVVLELSSFQLEIMTRSTQVAAILNITPNHLDRHGTMETYIAAKLNLLRHQAPAGIAVLGWDNAVTRQLQPAARRTVYFSGEAQPAGEAAFRRGERLFWRWEGREHEICSLADIGLRGHHNVLNVLAAGAISGAALSLAGVDAGAALAAMRAGLAGFTGVEHRLELVREWQGARWYNDSIASAPERVVAALRSFDEPIVLLLGGRDKKLPWDELATLVRERVRHVVLFGEAGDLIRRALEAAPVAPERITRCGPLREAVAAAARLAARGDVVLLSPGCTSFDEFKDFAERGEKFKAWVRAL